MSISFNTGTTGFINNAGTNAGGTLTIPAGVLSGDYVFVYVYNFTVVGTAPVISLTSTGTTPTLISSQTQATGNNFWSTARLYYFVASATDASKVLTFSESGGASNFWWDVGLVAYTGAGGIDVSAGPTSSYSASGTTGTTTTPSATTGVNGDWQIQFVATTAPSTNNYATPSGLTSRESIVNATNSGVLLAIADSNGSVGSSGTSIGNTTWTASGGSTGMAWPTQAVVGLQPAGGASNPNGTVQPVPTATVRRRPPARARVGTALAAAGLIGGAGVAGHAPRPFPVSHPQPQRARTGPAGRNAAGNLGPVNHAAAAIPLWQPQPRRPGPRRALWRGVAGPGNQTFTIPATPPPPWRPQPRRTPPVRATAKGVLGPGNHAAAAIPGVQPQIRHPQPQRAIWRGQAAPQPRPGPAPQRFLPPRIVRPVRAIWRGITGQPAAGVAVPAPKLLRQPPRRPALLRSVHRHIIGPGNAPVTYTVTSPLAGTATPVNTLQGTATVTNELEGVASWQ